MRDEGLLVKHTFTLLYSYTPELDEGLKFAKRL